MQVRVAEQSGIVADKNYDEGRRTAMPDHILVHLILDAASDVAGARTERWLSKLSENI